MSADLEITNYLRRRQVLEAIGADARYGGILNALGHRPAADARYCIQASEAMYCGSGAQENRRKLEKRLEQAGFIPAER